MLKTEALLGHGDFIRCRIEQAGLTITETWHLRLRFADVFAMYPEWQPRVATLVRLPPLFETRCYRLVGENAITTMHALKYQIRRQIWGFEFRKGGFLHAPDSVEEFREHRKIIARRIQSVSGY